MNQALTPSASLLCKLGFIVVRVDELNSQMGHEFDRVALRGLLDDQEVMEWIDEMAKMAMVPKKRTIEDLRAKLAQSKKAKTR